jgi:Fe-S-cluster-containing hydrogenase component 2
MKCPEDGLTISDFGQVIVAPTICNSCSVCVKACPIGAMELFEDILYVCDLCGGHPKCVEACTEGAISYEPGLIEVVSLEEIKSKTKNMNPSQKRHFYLQKQGAELRKKWRKEYA